MAVIYGDAERYYGTMDGFVIFDGASICRTDDVLAASPTWEQIDTGISGTILDVQCVPLADNTVGAWCLTDAAVYWCADIEAVTPSWSSKLAIATVQAADAVPTTGAVEFLCMAAHTTVDGYLIVATGPNTGFSSNSDYPHAYFWYTSDTGTSWTQVDMDDYLLLTSSSPDVYRGYCYSSVNAMEIDADGVIYCIRVAPVVGVGSNMNVFISSDLGATWSQGDELPSLTSNREEFSIVAPDANGVGYAVQGTIGVSNRPNLHRTTDSWASGTEIADPSGYGGIVSAVYRAARIYGDADFVSHWYRLTADTHHHLRQSNDQGDTGTTVWDHNSGGTGIAYNPPVNWPPDPLLWVAIANDPPSGDIASVVLTTANNFSTRTDRSGNLETLLGTWTAGVCGGFPIPKIALAVNGYAVADTYNQASSALVALDPQPRSDGVEITRRIHAPNGAVKDEELFLWLKWSHVATVAQYQSILTQLGLLTALTNQITISARDERFTWRRYNGIAVRPQIGSDGEWGTYFLRDVHVLVKFLEALD